MGYSTNFELRIGGEKDRVKEAFERLDEITDYLLTWAGGENAVYDILNEQSLYFEAKWYSREEDMAQIAKEFPDVRFYLEGEGENRDDWWIIEAQNGKASISRCVLISPSESDNWKEL